MAAADVLLAATRARFGDDCLSPYVLAIVAARSGRADAAIDHLAQAIAQRDPSAVLIPTEPSFASLHGKRDWVSLTRRLRPAARATQAS